VVAWPTTSIDAKGWTRDEPHSFVGTRVRSEFRRRCSRTRYVDWRDAADAAVDGSKGNRNRPRTEECSTWPDAVRNRNRLDDDSSSVRCRTLDCCPNMLVIDAVALLSATKGVVCASSAEPFEDLKQKKECFDFFFIKQFDRL
jgi:hypothetical protein